ncbi:MAG: hypothetical protein FD146_2634 [Anaerolineaceae bacterium]|nr:MAG: hypothetical protein FD146_2634 [Anaerolineaceae bacterium]
MKKVLVILLAVTLLAVTFVPAYAGGNGPGKSGATTTVTGTGARAGSVTGTATQQKAPRGTFAITGTIAAISSDPISGAKTVTVQVVASNYLVKSFVGTPVVVTVTDQTRFMLRTSTTTTATIITFADLQVGQPVSVNGIVANNIWTAQRITVGASLSCLPVP